MIGPHVYMVGCPIEEVCFIATGTMVFNRPDLKCGCEVTLGGMVPIGTTLEEEQLAVCQKLGK